MANSDVDRLKIRVFGYLNGFLKIKMHNWNYTGSNSVKKRMKFKKYLFHIYYIIRERIQLLNQFTSFTREKKVIFHDQMALLMAFGHS